MRKRLFYLCDIILILVMLLCGLYDLKGVQAVTENSKILITEIYYDTNGDDNLEEWIELYNPNNEAVDISSYKIGDEESKGGGEGMYKFPENSYIESQKLALVAKNAKGFYELYGKYPDYETYNSDDETTDFSQTADMIKYSSWSSGSLSLTNGGDEILLIDENDNIIDAVSYDGGLFPGIINHPGVDSGHSIQRYPLGADSDDCSVDFEDRSAPTPGYKWVYEAGDYYNNIGLVADDNEAQEGSMISCTTVLDTEGFMFYGPYTTDQSPGMYQASFRLRTSDNTLATNLVRIDARNEGGDGIWVYKDIAGTDFGSANSWQNFSIWFNRKSEGSMEFRVWYYDQTDIDFDNVMIGDSTKIVYEAEEMYHGLGTLVSDDGASLNKYWESNVLGESGHIVYGPYRDLPSGSYNISFVLKSSENTGDNQIASIDVNSVYGSNENKIINIKASDINNIDSWQRFEIGFANNIPDILEYRLFTNGEANIAIDNIIIDQADKTKYEAEYMYSSAGVIVVDENSSQGKYRQASVEGNDQAWMLYGPYTFDQNSGEYQACFNLKTSNNNITEPIARINAYNSGGDGLEVDRDILGVEFDSNNVWQEFCLPFTRTNQGSMEYRVWFYDLADIGVDFVEIGAI